MKTASYPAARRAPYARNMPEPETAGLLAEISMSPSAAQAFRGLDGAQARAVVEAFMKIGTREARPMSRRPEFASTQLRTYQVIVPALEAAPAVIYRRLEGSEGGGYLVMALVGRSDFETFERATAEGLLSTPTGQIASTLATTVASTAAGTISAAAFDQLAERS